MVAIVKSSCHESGLARQCLQLELGSNLEHIVNTRENQL